MPLAWALVNLANTYRFLGEIDKSLAAATESLAQFEGALGANHFSTIHPLASIAYAKAVRGDPDAEAFDRRGIANQASLPADNYERAVGLNFLGFVLLQTRGARQARRGARTGARRCGGGRLRRPTGESPKPPAGSARCCARRARGPLDRALLRESVDDVPDALRPGNARNGRCAARLVRVEPAARSPVTHADADGGTDERALHVVATVSVR